jgi:hypothetical protein
MNNVNVREVVRTVCKQQGIPNAEKLASVAAHQAKALNLRGSKLIDYLEALLLPDYKASRK